MKDAFMLPLSQHVCHSLKIIEHFNETRYEPLQLLQCTLCLHIFYFLPSVTLMWRHEVRCSSCITQISDKLFYVLATGH